MTFHQLAAPDNRPLFSASTRVDLCWFFGFALILLAIGIGLRDPWPADEPRFALAAKQMFESGDWLFPHRGIELYADKPPLFMALQAAAYSLVRSWRIAFLLPSLLAALGTLALTYDLARRLWNHRTGLYAAILLLFTVQFTFQAKKAQIDPTVSFFIMLSCYGLLRHVLLGPDWRWYWLAFFAAGLGVISKGVGFIALLVLLPYLFARWRGWDQLSRIDHGGWRWWLGPLFFLFAIALWLGPLLLHVRWYPSVESSAYLHDILFHQTAERFADAWQHQQPWWYFLGVIAGSWMPLVLTLPGTLPAWRDRFAARDARYLLPLVWLVLVVIFFSLSRGKRDVYILPALPMLALTTAPFLETLLQKRWLQYLCLGLLATLTVGLLTIGLSALFAHSGFSVRLAQDRGFDPDSNGQWWLLLGIGLIGLLSLVGFRRRRAPIGLLVMLTGVWLLFGLCGYPLLNPTSSASAIMARAAELAGPQTTLGLVAWKEQNLLQAPPDTQNFGFVKPWHEQLAQAMSWQREQPQQRVIFILDEALGNCVDKSRATLVGHANRRGWWLLRADAVLPDCVPQAVLQHEDDSSP